MSILFFMSLVVQGLSVFANKKNKVGNKNKALELLRTIQKIQTYNSRVGCCPFSAPALQFETEVINGATNAGKFNDWKAGAGSLGRISKIKVWSGDILSNMQIGYEKKWLKIHPITSAPQQNYFRIPSNDPLIKVSGVYGNYFGAQHFARVIFTLKSGREFGPFGTGQFMTDLVPFTLGGSQEKEIVAFFGGSFRHSDGSNFLSKLGVYLIHHTCGCSTPT